VVKAINAVRERGSPVMARKVQQRFKAMFEWLCREGGELPHDMPNPAVFTGRGAYSLAASTHVATPRASIPWRKIGLFATGLRAKEPRTTALCLEWIMLSITRSTETTLAQWCEIDREARVWSIPASRMKVKDVGPHRVPLTDRHLEILDLLTPPEGVDPSAFIFPACDATGPAGETMRQVLRAVWPEKVEVKRKDGSTVMKLADVHGFRSTFRTWAEAQVDPVTGGYRYEEKVMEMCLAHVIGDSTRNIYVSETGHETRRAILNDWAAFLAVEWSNVTAFPQAA
jgi:integrase